METNLEQIKPQKRRALLPARYKKQVIWQIWLPLLLALLGMVAIATLIIVLPAEGRTSINQLANVSTIFVLAPVLGIALVFVVVIGGLIYLVSLALIKLPGIGTKVQAFLAKLTRALKVGADGAAKPFILANGGFASLKKMIELFSWKRK